MKSSLFLLAALTAAVSSAQGALVIYNFDDPSSTAKLTADVSGADSGILSAGNFSGPGEADVSGGIDNAYLVSINTANNVAGALSSSDYFTFTITPTTGQTLQLNSLNFKFGATNFAVNAVPFTNNVIVQTSLGGLGTGGAILTSTPGSKTTGQTTNTAPDYVDVSTDTTGIIFSTALTVQIRIYDDSAANNAYTRLDDITLDITAVPEPSAAILAAAGAVFALGFRRRA